MLAKVAVITGGDSSIGRAVVINYTEESANIVIVFLNEHKDTLKIQLLIEKQKRKCPLICVERIRVSIYS